MVQTIATYLYTKLEINILVSNIKSSFSGKTLSIVRSENTSGGHFDDANAKIADVSRCATRASKRFLYSPPTI